MAQYRYGKNVVKQMIEEHKDIEVLYVQQDRKNDDIEALARKNHINVVSCSRKQLDNLVSGNHQGYIAEVKDYPLYDIDDIIETIPQGKQPLLVALDSLEDPHNLGAILRTAACTGVDGIIIEKNRSVSLNGTVAKVSCGAIDIVKVAQVTNLSQTLNYLKENGYWVIGTDMENASDYRIVNYDMPVVLVIGNEGKGMRPLIRKNCDMCVYLPMESNIGSLNASVATGVMLYQIYSQRFPVK